MIRFYHYVSSLLLLSPCLLYAQQPFEEYGYKPKVATLSKGKYVEFFDQDTLVEIGSVVLNVITGELVYFIHHDTTYSEATLQPEVISRWISPDPLSEKFYSYSPYHFSNNNPILFTDPDGRAASPYYDQDGNFLGNDEKGFTGNVYVTTKEAFNKNATNGVADSKAIQTDENTIGLQEADLSSQAVSNVYTNILEQSGYDLSKIENGRISIMKGDDRVNDPDLRTDYQSTAGPANKFKITINQQANDAKVELTTVENIVNSTGAHEYQGHGENQFGPKVTHYKAYEQQFMDKSWEGTTPDFKRRYDGRYQKILRENNPVLYKQKFPMQNYKRN